MKQTYLTTSFVWNLILLRNQLFHNLIRYSKYFGLLKTKQRYVTGGYMLTTRRGVATKKWVLWEFGDAAAQLDQPKCLKYIYVEPYQESVLQLFLQMKKHNNLKHHKLDHVRYMKLQRIEKNLDFKRRIYLCSLVLSHTMSILAVDFL